MKMTQRYTLMAALAGSLTLVVGIQTAAAQDTSTTSQQGQTYTTPDSSQMSQDSSQMPADTSRMAQDSSRTSSAQDSTPGKKWGYPVDTTGQQNPPGYRGMERPAGIDSAEAANDSGVADSSYQPNPTSHVQQRERQNAADSAGQPVETGAVNDSTPGRKWGYPVDTTGQQNPPGYRGMERPQAVGSDSTQSGLAQDSSSMQNPSGASSDTSSMSTSDSSKTRTHARKHRRHHRLHGDTTSTTSSEQGKTSNDSTHIRTDSSRMSSDSSR
ncbi:MAG TPA: hypothetical protein VFW66_00180 [Gemmatimonadales bacterium]|nr:hypothetical protein [Gemmatimonadales bacterium]